MFTSHISFYFKFNYIFIIMNLAQKYDFFFPYKKTIIKKFYPKLINRKNLRGTIFSCGRFAIEKWLRLCICWNLITFNIFVNITFTKTLKQGYIKIICILQYVGPFYILISILKNLIDFQRKIMSVYRQRFNI